MRRAWIGYFGFGLLAFVACDARQAPVQSATAEVAAPASAEAKSEPQTQTKKVEGNPMVVIKTSKGEIQVELFADKAPKTVENFLAYVDAGFFDGTIFHRVIPGFMIQGGGFDSAMSQKDTRGPIKNEAQNGVKNDRGTLAMARTNVVDSATAQFFINLVNNDFLNHTAPNERGFGYAAFGKVVKGMEVVDEIAKVKTTRKGPHADVPAEPVVIESIKRG
jgi:cyclophilin family peptidyl-prolyl cis-trans isomerase